MHVTINIPKILDSSAVIACEEDTKIIRSQINASVDNVIHANDIDKVNKQMIFAHDELIRRATLLQNNNATNVDQLARQTGESLHELVFLLDLCDLENDDIDNIIAKNLTNINDIIKLGTRLKIYVVILDNRPNIGEYYDSKKFNSNIKKIVYNK